MIHRFVLVLIINSLLEERNVELNSGDVLPIPMIPFHFN